MYWLTLLLFWGGIIRIGKENPHFSSQAQTVQDTGPLLTREIANNFTFAFPLLPPWATHEIKYRTSFPLGKGVSTHWIAEEERGRWPCRGSCQAWRWVAASGGGGGGKVLLMLWDQVPFSHAQPTGKSMSGWGVGGARWVWAAAGRSWKQERRKASQQKPSNAWGGASFSLWQETQKREAHLCLTEVLGEGSFTYDVVKWKRIFIQGRLLSLWKETWVQLDRAWAPVYMWDRAPARWCPLHLPSSAVKWGWYPLLLSCSEETAFLDTRFLPLTPASRNRELTVSWCQPLHRLPYNGGAFLLDLTLTGSRLPREMGWLVLGLGTLRRTLL